MNRSEFSEVLRDSFSAYYNIIMPEGEEEKALPLDFKADYFSRDEKYWLSKKITVWGNETNEFAYIFSAESFDNDTVDRCVDFALKQGLPRVRPHKEHQFTNIKVIFVADSMDNEIINHIRKKSFSKNYKFSLHGFTELKTGAVDLSTEKAYTNRAGREVSQYFSKLFAANNKK